MIKFSTSFFFFGGLASLFFSKPSSTAAALFFADDFAADAADECLTVETVQDFDLQTYISKPWYGAATPRLFISPVCRACLPALFISKLSIRDSLLPLLQSNNKQKIRILPGTLIDASQPSMWTRDTKPFGDMTLVFTTLLFHPATTTTTTTTMPVEEEICVPLPWTSQEDN
mmetsp:Transcript_8316/g.13154  ORF Transcript_8316/g.13154 Transcript_8316/m.13154 type:complete len:172 (-) Transcript_8316:1057-1572(-)